MAEPTQAELILRLLMAPSSMTLPKHKEGTISATKGYEKYAERAAGHLADLGKALGSKTFGQHAGDWIYSMYPHSTMGLLMKLIGASAVVGDPAIWGEDVVPGMYTRWMADQMRGLNAAFMGVGTADKAFDELKE